MSKMDGLRALREARYAQRGVPVTRPATTPKPPGRPIAATTAAPKPEAAAEDADSGLCGHRSMNGRTCTREQGHSAKSHRYS